MSSNPFMFLCLNSNKLLTVLMTEVFALCYYIKKNKYNE